MSNDDHRYTLLWHCSSGVTPEETADGVVLRRDGRIAAALTTTSDVPLVIRLQHADIDARRGYQLGGGPPRPSWTIELDVATATDCTIVTELRLH